MSDPITDAHRPDNQPKGMGWWPNEQQSDYCRRIWERGDRDFWLIGKMRSLGLLTPQEARKAYEEHHPEWVADTRARFAIADQSPSGARPRSGLDAKHASGGARRAIAQTPPANSSESS